MNKEQLKELLKNNTKTGSLDWKRGIELTKQNKTIIEVVKRLADK